MPAVRRTTTTRSGRTTQATPAANINPLNIISAARAARARETATRNTATPVTHTGGIVNPAKKKGAVTPPPKCYHCANASRNIEEWIVCKVCCGRRTTSDMCVKPNEWFKPIPGTALALNVASSDARKTAAQLVYNQWVHERGCSGIDCDACNMAYARKKSGEYKCFVIELAAIFEMTGATR